MTRPLTFGTLNLLVQLEREGGMYAGCDTGNASRLTALRKRGFAIHEGMGARWRITDAGRAYLAQVQQ